MAYAQRYVFPVEMWSIGDIANNIIPNAADLQNWKQLINQSIQQPPFCVSDDTRILTESGFKTREELTPEDKIATVNPTTNVLEYHKPNNIYTFDYEGEMIHFQNAKIDHLVTPDHECWTATRNKDDWHKVKAKDVVRTNKFKLEVDWEVENTPEFVDVCGRSIPIDDFVKWVGYFVTEGWTHEGKYDHCTQYQVGIGQSQASNCYKDIDDLYSRLPFNVREGTYELAYEYTSQKNIGKVCTMQAWKINDKELTRYFQENFGVGSYNKKIPIWVKNLSKDKLKILLDAIIAGDGSIHPHNRFPYYQFRVTSKKLAEDVFEIALKCGYSPKLVRIPEGRNPERYGVYFSDYKMSNGEAYCYSLHGSKDFKRTVKYSGKVWCVDVPNHLFIAERNGKAIITGNSLVTPPYVKYEALSTAGKTFPVNTEWYEYTLSQLMIGLGVNKNLMTGDGPSFSGGLKGMSLHRLMMEYKFVRDKFEDWIIHKFYEPIAEKNQFYTTENGQKKLILPELMWKKSLDIEDAESEREMFVKMWESGVISTETLFTKFPTLDFKQEQKKLELERGTIFDSGERLPAKIHKSVVKPGGDTGFGGAGGGGGAPGAIRPIKPLKPIAPGKTPEGAGETLETPETTSAGGEAPAVTPVEPGV